MSLYNIMVSYRISHEYPEVKARIKVHENFTSYPDEIFLKDNGNRSKEIFTKIYKLEDKQLLDQYVKKIITEAMLYVKYLSELEYLPYNCAITEDFEIKV